MIAVIDYGVGNVGSIVNMLKRIGVSAVLTNTAEMVEAADKLILPGVGSFDEGMQRLQKSGLTESIRKHAITEEKPLLGICLGMQMLGRKSEEGSEAGLAFIPFETKRFDFSDNQNLKIPHMGWDLTTIELKDDPVMQNLASPQRYYYVHAYHAICDKEENVLMRCEYGYSFAAAVKYKNIYGFQFHPEKSHRFGMVLLENFARNL